MAAPPYAYLRLFQTGDGCRTAAVPVTVNELVMPPLTLQGPREPTPPSAPSPIASMPSMLGRAHQKRSRRTMRWLQQHRPPRQSTRGSW